FCFFVFCWGAGRPPPPNTITKKITLQHYRASFLAKNHYLWFQVNRRVEIWLPNWFREDIGKNHI
ncbi:MAG: hypothetical protein ACK5H8_02685, partial [Pseudanabaena sp.]